MLNLLNWAKFGIRDAQTYFDYYYPPERRTEITSLNIYFRGLKGSLEIKDFPNLTRIHCSNNQITKLTIINCLNVKFLNCGYNKLTSLDFLENLNQEKLANLSIEGNDFSNQDLSPLEDEKHPKFTSDQISCYNNLWEELISKTNESQEVFYDTLEEQKNKFQSQIQFIPK